MELGFFCKTVYGIKPTTITRRGVMDLKEAIKHYADLITLGSAALRRVAENEVSDTNTVAEFLALLDQINVAAASLKLLTL